MKSLLYNIFVYFVRVLYFNFLVYNTYDKAFLVCVYGSLYWTTHTPWIPKPKDKKKNHDTYISFSQSNHEALSLEEIVSLILHSDNNNANLMVLFDSRILFSKCSRTSNAIILRMDSYSNATVLQMESYFHIIILKTH